MSLYLSFHKIALLILLLGVFSFSCNSHKKNIAMDIANKDVVADTSITNKNLGQIGGFAYDCNLNILPYASLFLNKMPDSLDINSNVGRAVTVFSESSFHEVTKSDSTGTFLFDNIPVGYYQVGIMGGPLDGPQAFSCKNNVIDFVVVIPDSCAIVHLSQMGSTDLVYPMAIKWRRVYKVIE